jgi:hypothetical protein
MIYLIQADLLKKAQSSILAAGFDSWVSLHYMYAKITKLWYMEL